MAHQSHLISQDIKAYLKQHENKSLLRFITCGSVDDGKSSLIGRMLYESKLIYEDQLNALAKDSKHSGTQGGNIDFALLVDGLQAEREQGITIDVAYRYFSTDKRKFIVADTPGHEQYTRNMATGASTADLAILMIDARKGVLQQTRRHATIVQLLGVRHVVLAINKMDLVQYSQDNYEKIVDQFMSFAKDIKLCLNKETGEHKITAIPVSAVKGDLITKPSCNMSWYSGMPLMPFLETVVVDPIKGSRQFSMPIQWVNRPNLDYRAFSGQISSGSLTVGETVCVLPSKKESVVKSIDTFDATIQSAQVGQSVNITLCDELDASRGDVLVTKQEKSHICLGKTVSLRLLWMAEDPLLPQRQYWIKHSTRLMLGKFSLPNYKLDINTLEKLPAKQFALNEIGSIDLTLDQVAVFAPYTENKVLGSLIVIDRLSNNTVAMAVVESINEQSEESHMLNDCIQMHHRAQLKQQKPACFVFRQDQIHLAQKLESHFFHQGLHTMQIAVSTQAELQEQASLLLNAGLVCIAIVPQKMDLPDSIQGCLPILCESKSLDQLVVQKAKENWQLKVNDGIFEEIFTIYLSN